MEFKKIIGTGYIGQDSDLIWLQENVVNVWRGSPSNNCFLYRTKGFTYYLQVCVRTSKNSFKTILVTNENINMNIKNLIEEKHNIKL